MALERRFSLTPYLLLAPALGLFGFAILGPVLATGYFSFFEWDGFGEMIPVGFDNYERALSDPVFVDSFKHVFLYIALTMVFEVLIGLVLAGLVTAQPRGTAFFRLVFFIPAMLPIAVVAIIWRFVYNPDLGLINGGLRSVGADSLTRIWLGDEKTALIAVAVVSGWIFSGFFMAIFYAGIRQIPSEVLEAARLDGASELKIFWKIKVPLIKNVILVTMLLAVTGGFQGFDLFFVMTNGGPFGATEIPTTYLVRVVFRNQNVGYGAALAMIMTLTVLILSGVFALSKRAISASGTVS